MKSLSTIGQFDTILDLGCGTGEILSFLPESWEGEYIGIDTNEESIARAVKLYPQHYFTSGQAEELLDAFQPTGEESSLEVIVSDEIYEVLKEKIGKCLLSVKSGGTIHPVKRDLERCILDRPYVDKFSSEPKKHPAHWNQANRRTPSYQSPE